VSQLALSQIEWVRANLRLLGPSGSASPEDDGRIICGSNLEQKNSK
jgi:hypothetical protein